MPSIPTSALARRGPGAAAGPARPRRVPQAGAGGGQGERNPSVWGVWGLEEARGQGRLGAGGWLGGAKGNVHQTKAFVVGFRVF